ncbi:MAG: Glycerol-3-phosphate dehydrogenase [NAD(P)+] [Chlamydiales bacterium]|nr:Glycerol-3-phosphate dehydrogenase [NAD(P)+] [Chlamydiales bacterium]MCH9635036.1 Glycerol-3-phosphate dehydrogenase [NAD(P)+] [Chlamydiales bacterium]
MKIGYLGAGIWGYTLASLLASKEGYEVVAWSIEEETVRHLEEKREHPRAPGFPVPKGLTFTTNIDDVLHGVDLVVEGVTSAGIRPVFETIKKHHIPDCPIVLTSKGIEQNSGLLLTDVVVEILGQEHRKKIGCLSGPSIAMEVLQGHPTSVTCSGYDEAVMAKVHEAFSTPFFRVYPNGDIDGIELGGAMKNIIAIACGISDGLGYGDNAKAALMTRGLHEIRKLAAMVGCQSETLNGLAGMGDLCVTCLSKYSRNYRFGNLIAQGRKSEEAKSEIGMVVEGTYTCLSAMQLAKKHGVDLPITTAVYKVVYEDVAPQKAVMMLLERATKHEHL